MPRLPRAARELLKENGIKEQDVRILAAMDRKWKNPMTLGADAGGVGMRSVGASLARLILVRPPVLSVRLAPWKASRAYNMYEYRIVAHGTRLIALFEQARSEET